MLLALPTFVKRDWSSYSVVWKLKYVLVPVAIAVAAAWFNLAGLTFSKGVTICSDKDWSILLT